MMNVTVLRYPTKEDWERCKMMAMNTIGKNWAGEVTDIWKDKILRARHSPIRTLMFTIKMEVPYYVSVHFVRHKYGVEHYVSSQRNDRQDKYDRREAKQSIPVIHIMDVNAEELMAIANRRLCNQADVKTREVMNLIVKEVLKTNPEFTPHLVPQCLKLGLGICPEFKPCGRMSKKDDK